MIEVGVWLAFALLGLAICAVWLPAVRFGRALTLSPSFLLLGAAIPSAIAAGVLSPPAVVVLATMAGVSMQATRVSGAMATLLTLMAATMALVLALHLAPGFRNPIIVDAVRLSDDAAAFTQYANFDKGAAGLLLLLFCRRARTLEQWRRLAAPTAIAAVATSTAVVAVGMAIGIVRPDPKLPAFALMFLTVNLLFTCVAEEAFFRGWLQERLARRLSGPSWRWMPVVASAVVFGAAHSAGGPALVLLATIGGAGYALAYAATRRIEAAVLTHFTVNAVHFFGFTYPRLQT